MSNPRRRLPTGKLSQPSIFKSAMTARWIPGYCTLTATSSPVRATTAEARVEALRDSLKGGDTAPGFLVYFAGMFGLAFLACLL